MPNFKHVILDDGSSFQFESNDLQFLRDLGNKINAQDPRGTQFPMFVIKQKVKVYGDSSYCSEKERREDYDGEVCEKCQRILDEGGYLPEDCNDCDDECFVYFNWEDQIVENCGSFFTAEAAQQHIDQNYYHYTKPFTYAIGSWRNYELQNVLEILSKFGTGLEAISQYK